MSIDRIQNDASLDAANIAGVSAGNIKDADKARSIRPGADQQGGDDAEVSRLSQIMANAGQDLEAESAVRPEKVAAFRSLATSPLKITDQQIDVVLKRMSKI